MNSNLSTHTTKLNPDFAIQIFNTEQTGLKRVSQRKLFSYSVQLMNFSVNSVLNILTPTDFKDFLIGWVSIYRLDIFLKLIPHRYTTPTAKFGLNPKATCAFAIATFLTAFCLVALSDFAIAQGPDSLVSASALKRLSLEELMNIEVTSVSKHVEKLKETASAIQVITQNDIRSAGVKTLPEALRLASNLQVAQANSSQWAISARGFNNVLADKLLVLIDGRTIYTPMYAGVFWDVQNLLLEDVDRIEVISGPGGALWGANAVNGVINIITKNSKDTQGLFAEGATGTGLPGLGSLRYGEKPTDNFSYRIYATGFNMGSTILTNGNNSKDEWAAVQGGLRLDWEVKKNNQLTLQANVYNDDHNPEGIGKTSAVARGNNIVSRWTHKTSEKSEFQMQAYYDHTWRDFGSGLVENLKTYDLDWQNQYKYDERQVLTSGFGIRVMDDRVDNIPLLAFLPGHKVLELYSSFLQDEITLFKERLRLTLGIKIEHNSYTGFEYQPNARLAWTPAEHHTIWTAVSRAVRAPSRIDRDFFLYATPTFPLILGNKFMSEQVLAYELGWRLQPFKRLSVSLSTFYNFYDNLRSVEPGSPPPLLFPVTYGNGAKGETYGAELSTTYQLADWWRLRGGYTFLQKHLWVKPNSKDLNNASGEGNDPEHQFLIQSTMNLPGRIELGTVIRYVDKLPKPYVPDYMGLDVHLGWKLNKNLELNIVGQNLLHSRHPEFIPSNPSPREIERSVYAKITCRF